MDLAESFDQYVDDLREIFGARPSTSDTSAMPAHCWIEKNRTRIEALFSTWTLPEACEESVIDDEIENLLAVTRCYGFAVREGDEARVWARTPR